MEYGILVVEDGNGLYQVLSAVHTVAEAREVALDYEINANPDSADCSVPPYMYVIHRRNGHGYYTVQERLFLA